MRIGACIWTDSGFAWEFSDGGCTCKDCFEPGQVTNGNMWQINEQILAAGKE